ncbi:hypothetical protein, partial [Streptomyces boncukensis]
ATPPASGPLRALRGLRGLGLYATVVCALAVVAAVVSFANGSWLGILWVLLAGLTSNMAWYYVRKSRMERS